MSESKCFQCGWPADVAITWLAKNSLGGEAPKETEVCRSCMNVIWANYANSQFGLNDTANSTIGGSSMNPPIGTKLDSGKPRMHLVLHSMPRAIYAVAQVAEYGAQKYSPDGWLHVENGEQRYTDAMLRHTVSEGMESRDQESNLLHAAHTAWNALARLELMLRGFENMEDEE